MGPRGADRERKLTPTAIEQMLSFTSGLLADSKSFWRGTLHWRE
jgi:hypothetical protein